MNFMPNFSQNLEFKWVGMCMMMSSWRALKFQACKINVKKSLLTLPQINIVKIFACEGKKLKIFQITFFMDL
jgi:hypothetical protein